MQWCDGKLKPDRLFFLVKDVLDLVLDLVAKTLLAIWMLFVNVALSTTLQQSQLDEPEGD